MLGAFAPSARIVRRAAVVSVLVASLVAPSSPAAAEDALSPEVGVDANGRAVVVWKRSDGSTTRIEARRRSASGNLSSVKLLSPAGEDATQGQVAVDPKGNAVVVWTRFDGDNWRIQARRRSASGSLSPVQTLSPAGEDAEGPQVAVDPKGNAVVVWQRNDGSNTRIQARRRSASGNLSSVKTLSAAGQDASEAQVAVDPRGNAVVVWKRDDGSDDRVQARRRSASGRLSSVKTLSKAGQETFHPQVEVDSDGNAVVVWERWDGDNWRVQARRRSASGNLSSVKTLSAAGQDGESPQVAVDAKGNAVIAWHRGAGSDARIQARRRSASGSLSPVKNLSQAGLENVGRHRLGMDAKGNVVVVWEMFDGIDWRIQARRRSASGRLSSVKDVSPDGQPANNPAVAVDPNGNAVVVWEGFDGSDWLINARRRSASGSLSSVKILSPA